MRTRITYFALLTLLLSACVREETFSPQTKGEGIVLDLVLEGHQTKATRNGEDALNENVISSALDIFFYDESTEEITKEVLGAVRSGNRIEIQTNPNDIESIFGTRAAGAHCGVFIVSNYSGTYEGTAGSRTLSEIKSSVLQAPNFSSGTPLSFVTQDSFVLTGEQELTLGNAQGSTPVYATVGLERVAAKITFDVTVAETLSGEGEGWVPQTENGAMTVYMVYPMRKATLGAEAVDMPINANVTYGSGEAMVYAQSYEAKLWPDGTTKSRERKSGDTTTNVDSPVYTTLQSSGSSQVLPFYTYPCQWSTGSSMEPYMKLIIPWHNINTSKYYYKIPFAGNSIERNHWYHISIDVQILGTEQAEPPEVTITYSIADWSGELDTSGAEEITSITSVPATVISAKYLNVPTTEYVLYDEDELVIPIQSSSEVEVVGFDVVSTAYQASHQVDENYVGTNPRIYNPFSTTLNASDEIVAVRPDYSSITPSAVSHAFTYNQAADAQGWSVTVNGRESVTLNHALNNDTSTSDYDVAPYTIRMRIRHKGEGATLYFTDVTVEQRPSIIIKPEANSGGTSNYGYAYVNSAQNNGDNWTRTGSGWSYTYSCTDGTWTGASYYGNSTRNPSAYDYWDYYLGSSPSDLSNSSNKNTNMYVIETSVLPTSGAVADYMLGDPRSKEIDNLGQTWSQSKASVQGDNRRITYYYPAGGAEYSNFIAPKFRIASSFGSTQPMTFDNAKRRCSSYQEDGYPAGRWRLPTVAEITYMAQLTTDNLIPRLLGGDDDSTTDYWSNNGYVTVPGGESSASLSSSTGTSGTKYVRCVYDEWYWEGTTYEKVTKTTFTWGDQDRSTVRMAEN